MHQTHTAAHPTALGQPGHQWAGMGAAMPPPPAPSTGAAPPAPAPRLTLSGIDVSGIGQGATFDWSAWKGRIQFAFIKATEGNGFRDPDFARNWAAAPSAGVIRGAYHFLRPLLPGADQARFFLSVAQPNPGDLVALDYEVLDGLTPEAGAACAVEFVDEIRALVGAWPVAYTDRDMATNGACAGLGQCPSWIANPQPPNGPVPIPIGPWSLLSFEQPGQRGVDTDIFYGSIAQLQRLTVMHRVGPAPAPPPRPVALTSYRLTWPNAAAVPILAPQHSTDGGKSWT